MLVDFHSHSTLSDGMLSIEEMVAAAERRGYEAYAVTDHARGDDAHYWEVASMVREAVERLRGETSMHLFAGVELTEFPPDQIFKAAERVRDAGAEVVVVHGECVSMDVAPGTNAAGVRCPDVDVLAHPGLVTEEEADEAARSGIFLELSARHGHCWANGHVFHTAVKTGASIAVDSDAHDDDGLLSEKEVSALIRGAGGSQLMLRHVVDHMTIALLQRVQRRAEKGSGVGSERLFRVHA